MSEQWTTMPTSVAAWLVAEQVDALWQRWAFEEKGCCPGCCASCAALERLMHSGLLDDLYRTYMQSIGGGEVSEVCAAWDYDRQQINRAWLVPALTGGTGGLACACPK